MGHQDRKCLTRHSGVLPDPDLTEYAYSLAKADRYQEAIDVLDLLNNPNTPRALNYRGYATRKLGRTDEGIGYYLKSVALDPNYPQVREYLGEAYVIQGKYDLARHNCRRSRSFALRTASTTRTWRTRSRKRTRFSAAGHGRRIAAPVSFFGEGGTMSEAQYTRRGATPPRGTAPSTRTSISSSSGQARSCCSRA